jgi:hypothetical protein
MLRRLFALSILITAIALVIGLHKHASVSRGQSVDPATLSGIAVQAQADGQTEIALAKNLMYEGVDDLNGAISRYTIVDAVPIAKQSYVLDEFNIGTWYKFRLNYWIKQNPQVSCTQCSSNIPDPPADMLPLNSNEILVLHPGGSQVVNDVTISFTVPEFPDFNLNQRYVLFIDFDSSRQVGSVSVGPPGAYVVDASGRMLHVYDADPEDTIGSGLAAGYGSNADTFRNALNPPPPSTCDPLQEQNCYDAGGSWNSSTCSCYVPQDPCTRRPWLCE